NTGHHCEGEKTRTYESHDADARFGLYAPNGVERILQLAKDAASAEKGQQNSNACRQHTLVRLRRFLGDTLDYIDGALIQKVAHSRKAAGADAKECVCALISRHCGKSQHSLPNIYPFVFVRVRRAFATRTFSIQARSSFNGIKFTIRSGGIFAANAAARARSMNSNCQG